MTLFDLTAFFFLTVALTGWLNARYLHWPQATIMVLAGLVVAGVLSALHTRWPDSAAGVLVDTISGFDFPRAVLGYMLAFLLFAGAMQVDLAELRRRHLSVWTLATLGVVVSTTIVGGGLWAIARGLGIDLALPWALVFGALISPTDPIAVLAAVRGGKLSKRMEVILQGEALFNDGVGIVIFLAAVAIASGSAKLDPVVTLGHVGIEAVGGALLGLVGGWLCVRVMRTVDEYAVEVALTLALATGLYALAGELHVSGPIAVVVAGLLVGDSGFRTAMSETTQRYLRGFWSLIDELMNALLFLMLGLELLVVAIDLRQTWLWVGAIVLVLVARFAVVLPWGAYFRFREQEPGASLILGWGGLHGALSLALALSLPPGSPREILLPLTFAVVIFSVTVQGLTFAPLAARLARLRTSQD